MAKLIINPQMPSRKEIDLPQGDLSIGRETGASNYSATAATGSLVLASNSELHLGTTADTPERLAAAWAQVSDRDGEQVPASGSAQGSNEVSKAFAARG